MVFNRKGSFFLELDGKAAETPVTVAPVAEKPAKAEKAAKTEAKVAVKAPAAAKTDSTFAPECVTAGGALPMRRRRAGANVAGFRDMASGMFGKK